MKAEISEIFSSVQGEGREIGRPFLFIRFSGCNLSCNYCDSRYTMKSPAVLSGEIGTQSFHFQNPLGSDDLISLLQEADYPTWLSFTGGEPLLQAEFIESLFPALKKKKLLLETNATLPEKLTEKMISRIDVVSADVKLPSVAGLDCLSKTEEFLSKLGLANFVTLKAVFSKETPDEEIESALFLSEKLHQVNPNMALIFQPITRNNLPEIGENLESIVKRIERVSFECRIVPQIHPILGLA